MYIFFLKKKKKGFPNHLVTYEWGLLLVLADQLLSLRSLTATESTTLLKMLWSFWASLGTADKQVLSLEWWWSRLISHAVEKT